MGEIPDLPALFCGDVALPFDALLGTSPVVPKAAPCTTPPAGDVIDALFKPKTQLPSAALDPTASLPPPVPGESFPAITMASSYANAVSKHGDNGGGVGTLLVRTLSLSQRAPWLHDFLFADVAAADVAMLTAPTALAAGCHAEVRETSVEMGTDGGYSTVLAEWELIPAFCVGTVTAGVAATSVNLGNGAVRAYGRFLRDERTSEVLLYRREGDGKTSIVHMALRGSTGRSRIYLSVEDVPKGNAPEMHHVRYVCTTTEARMCTVCMAPPSADCGCQLKFRTPTHPLDYGDCLTMAHHLGDFYGHGITHIVGAPPKHHVSRAVIAGGGGVSSLAGWAVRERLIQFRPSAAPTVDYTAPAVPCTPVISVEPHSARRVLAASAYVQGSDAVISGFIGDANDVEAERAVRKHQRKLRNRVAAARSNQKRKENYLNLQRDVSEIRDHKASLSARLERLRAENAELRRRITHM